MRFEDPDNDRDEVREKEEGGKRDENTEQERPGYEGPAWDGFDLGESDEDEWWDEGPESAAEAEREAKRRARQEREKFYRREGREFPPLARELALKVEAEAGHHFKHNGLAAADIIFCLMMRVYYHQFSVRRLDFILEQFQRQGYISEVPSPNTVLHHFRLQELMSLIHWMIGRTSLPFRLLDRRYAVDSTKLSTYHIQRTEDGHVVTSRGSRPHILLKLHLMCGLTSLSVMAARATPRRAQDVEFLRPLMAEVVERGFEVKSLAADKGYLSKENNRFVEKEYGVKAYLTFKRNSRMSKNGSDPVWDRSLARYREMKALGIKLKEERIRIEAINWMIKGRFGREVRGLTQTAQFNEALMKVVCHNLTRLIRYEVGLDDVYLPWQHVKG